ncbi:RnfABCDGE type electron transport complex subunit D [Aidingimonas halophila]|uniref:Ion-translocating oxidoreductase complex subunit D n=1 Tax=Aidingimonas halophila TaxID=574349 RepID=A0A1H3HA46_9GAMM|nr:RnfABCDGE type electron transport complex subunit D [Aidingimonas halophila]GHC36405.1 electron transport complex subunit D [Aidingimonas halophila]SDY12352.1 electron transport complex protein RnfD [Aidingimonas halophila]
MSLMHAEQTAIRHPGDSGRLMAWVAIATLPGIITLTWHFGWGVITNILLAILMGWSLEATVMRLRRRPIVATLRDNSALVTAILLGASLPPASPWWLLLVGMIAAIIVAKHLFGGLGHNPFNPAMVGYALLLISFPVPMTQWTAPLGLLSSQAPSLSDIVFHITGLSGTTLPDTWTGATALDAFKNKPETVMASEFWATSPLPEGARTAWYSVSLAWLAGGMLLLYQRIIGWQIPAAMLGSVLLAATVLYAVDPSHHGSPLFHLLGGATLFGAFFIATDPVSAATSRRGKLFYGAGIGLLIMLIRTSGGYPDAVAFAVLLMNFTVPFIDYYTQPRAQGHSRPNHGIKPPPSSNEDRR